MININDLVIGAPIYYCRNLTLKEDVVDAITPDWVETHNKYGEKNSIRVRDGYIPYTLNRQDAVEEQIDNINEEIERLYRLRDMAGIS